MVRLLPSSEPTSLEDACLDSVCASASAICNDDKQSPLSTTPHSLISPFSPLSPSLSDGLLRRFSENGQVNDKTLSLFTGDQTCLKNAYLANCEVSVEGLKVLREHTLDSLHLVNVKGIGVDEVIDECISEDTVGSLTRLNVSNTLKPASVRESNTDAPDDDEADPIQIFDTVESLARFRNLTCLTISHTDIGSSALETICASFAHLDFLDISSTHISDISAVENVGNTVRFLIMNELRLVDRHRAVEALSKLKLLEVLDVSEHPDGPLQGNTLQDQRVTLGALLVHHPDVNLPCLRVLDVSGTQGNFDVNKLCHFINAHLRLEFMGLLMTNACYFDLFLQMENDRYERFVQVAGEATRLQILAALKSYLKRKDFCAKALFHLFTTLNADYQSFSDVELDESLKHVIYAMRHHIHSLNVQMAGTACLYNYCRSDRSGSLHPGKLRLIIDTSMCAIENHPDTLQLHKNVWLTLCSDSILQSQLFDQFRCCHNALKSMVVFQDQAMTRMAVAIVSILAAKIPTEQTTVLGTNPTYMKHLLRIVSERVERALASLPPQEDPDAPPNVPPPDVTLKFTLSALWNLTDESPETCICFLARGGLGTVMEVLKVYKDPSVETKVLGLLNNVAEVSTIKHRLTGSETLEKICELLHSSKIDVSYFAAGILAHLCSDEDWQHSPSRADCEQKLFDVVSNWLEPDNEMVAYRSFTPFFPLLRKVGNSGVQIWAVWAIRHVCAKSKAKYAPMFAKEEGRSAVNKIIMSPLSEPKVINIACDILKLVDSATR